MIRHVIELGGHVVPYFPCWFIGGNGDALVTSCAHLPTDQEIVAQIKAKFSADPVVKPAEISVAVQKGEVTLSGIVATEQIELQALILASSTNGVQKLNDGLTVTSKSASHGLNGPALASTKSSAFVTKSAGGAWNYPWPQEPTPQQQQFPDETQTSEQAASSVEPMPQPLSISFVDSSEPVDSPNPDSNPDTTGNQKNHEIDDLNGTGASFPAPLYRKWSSDYQSVAETHIRYQATSSGHGLKAVTDDAADFAASDTLPSASEVEAFASRNHGHRLLAFPTVLGAVVPVYNLPGLSGELNFSGPVLADVYLGKIKRWNDPAITNLNPGINLPATPIVVLHRSDASGTIACLTDYLSKLSPEWQKTVGRNSSVAWPMGLGATGNLGVATLLKQNIGSIGFVDLTYAARNQMPSGKVLNQAGEYVRADMKTVSAAAGAAALDGQSSITNPPGKGDYPISYFTWLWVPDAYREPGKATAMRGFLRWAITTGQRDAEPLQYARLPKIVVAKAEKQISLIR